MFEWGAAAGAGDPVTVYRVLVRNGLVEPKARRRRRKDYRAVGTPGPMQLWQLDVTGSVFLADGRRGKIVTGVDDHSRFWYRPVVLRATARAVCRAFVGRDEGLRGARGSVADNGKQFTGRFGRPRPAEVLFERICRENGITQRLTKASGRRPPCPARFPPVTGTGCAALGRLRPTRPNCESNWLPTTPVTQRHPATPCLFRLRPATSVNVPR